jgi:predicted CoA-binding protein
MINDKCIVMDWKENIITTNEGIRGILENTGTIAVLGIKPESRGMQAAFYVPKYMQDAGHRIIPVPVYYPEVAEIMGEKVYRNMEDIPVEIDMLNVFRRSEDIPAHTEDILRLKPKSVWIQLGIRNDEVAETLAKAGIKVVQDACLMVEHRSLM